MTNTECKHGIIPAACTLCNGRGKPSRPASSLCISWEQRRPSAVLPSITLADVAGDLPAGWARAAASGEPIAKVAKCTTCPTKGVTAGKRVWAITERFPHGTWVPKVNPSTHRVRGKAICDECCRARCSRCQQMTPERHIPGKAERKRAERASQSVFAIATGHSSLG